MNWDDLSVEEQDKWNDLASKKRNIDIVLLSLENKSQCPFCGYKFKSNQIKKLYPTKSIYEMFKGTFLVHVQTTHGLTPEIFELILMEKE